MQSVFSARKGVYQRFGRLGKGAKEEIMTWMPVEWARRETLPDGKVLASDLSRGLRIASVILRALFIACLLVVTFRVSMPQNETIWTAYETPGDLIRMGLGLAVCVWLVIQLFMPTKDTQHHRTWLYLGRAAVPFALICVIAVW
jgi:hypothetical protein